MLIAIVLFVVLGHHKTSPKNNGVNTQQSSSNDQSSPPTKPTTAQLKTLIAGDDNPLGIQYTITSSDEPVSGWFVVHVIAKNTFGTFKQVTVLHQDSGNQPPDVVAGPGDSFPITYLHSISMPDAVIKVLPTYDDSGSYVTGDAATLAKQVMANQNIVLGPTAQADLQAAAQNEQVMPGPAATGDIGTSPCSNRQPTYLSATLLQAMLNIAQKYNYEIAAIVSGHNCDSGRSPLGRGMDIYQVSNKPIDWTTKNTRDFASYVIGVMAKLLPDGHYIGGRPVNMAGIGIGGEGCIPLSAFSPPSNINYFSDSCSELHVDVGFSS